MPASSLRATTASNMLQALQLDFINSLKQVSRKLRDEQHFTAIEWFRDQGKHGGGLRYCVADSAIFNNASINYSQVHYGGQSSATALSTIVHPDNPHAASIHIHISWSEAKNGSGYWRIMADLNPALIDTKAAHNFQQCLKQAAPDLFALASAQGDRYFYIPALKRHRGIQHFYLENYHSGNEQNDLALAQAIGSIVINNYCALLLQAHPTPNTNAYNKQLAYHTLYFFQVLTLDRGTTAGIRAHQQNDTGILASLPKQIDYFLLSNWQAKVAKPQNFLMQAILQILPKQSPCPITATIKQSLAQCIRKHYQQYPTALKLQAASHIAPPDAKQ